MALSPIDQPEDTKQPVPFDLGTDAVEDVIARLRKRGDRANARSLVVLAALLIVILVALAFYLGLPFLRDAYNGRKLALEDSIAAADQTLAELDSERTDLFAPLDRALRWQAVSIPGDWPRSVSYGPIAPAGTDALLVAGSMGPIGLSIGTLLRYDFVRGTAEPVPGDWSNAASFNSIAPAGSDALLVAGSNGTLLRYDIALGTAEPVTGDWSNDVSFGSITPTGTDALLIAGSNGTLLRYDIALGTAEPVAGDWSEGVSFGPIAPAGTDALLVAGSRGPIGSSIGTLLRYDIARGTAESIPGDWSNNVAFGSIAPAGTDALLVAGSSGTLLRYDITLGVAEPVAGDWSDDVTYRTIAPAGSDALMVAGSNGTLLRYDIALGTAEPVTGDWSDGVSFGSITPAGTDALLVLSDSDPFEQFGSTLLRYDIALGTAEPVAGGWSNDVSFNSIAPAGTDGFLVAGSNGTLLRYDIALGTAEAVAGDWSDGAWLASITPAGTDALLVVANSDSFGLFGGTLLRYDIALGTAEPVPGDWSDGVSFGSITPAGTDGFLVAGRPGTLVRVSNDFANALAEVGINDDGDLQRFLESLPQHIRQSPEVVAVETAFRGITGQRAVVVATKTKAQEDLDAIPSGLFRLNEQREHFESFMATCRGVDGEIQGPAAPRDGVTDADPDRVTLACTEAWQKELEREQQTWWQTVAVQVPPGILLLFLLATLGALYRYNLRLAGFHHSRADMLELMRSARSYDAETMLKLSDALAADKVEFGKANTPADQAVEIARAVMGRAK